MTGKSAANGMVDFDLHGLAAVRIIGAHEGDVHAVARQLGPIRLPAQQRPSREPQIVIRFVDGDEINAQGVATYVDLGRTAFVAENGQAAQQAGARRFYVLQGKHKTPARVQIALQDAGRHCEILCQHGVAAVPYLIPILNLTVLANGALPLHAGGFVYNGAGVLVTGWSKGGKTEALLGFMARGAEYVADEWTYLFEGGQCMAGIPEPIRLWAWHLREMPGYRRALSRGQRLRLATLGAMQRALGSVAPQAGRGFLSSAHRLQAALARQQGVNVAPARLFGKDRWAAQAPVDYLFFVVNAATEAIDVRPIDPQEIARRMVFSLQEEQRHLQSLYRQFRFAFPDAANDLLEQSEEMQAARLQNMLAGKEAYLVSHPYPAPIEAMTAAMEKALR